MKKISLFLVMLCMSLSFVTKTAAQTIPGTQLHPNAIQFQITVDPAMEGKFYPSLALWNSTQEDPSDLFYGFKLNAPHANAVIRITVEATSINEETIIQVVADKSGELEICPVIKWKYDQLTRLAQGGVVTLTCILNIDGKEIDRINYPVKYRPINECVYGVQDGDEWVDFRQMFALYVNEDYPVIDKILQEILAVDRNRSFLDYQGEAQDFTNQLIWIWEYFSNKGTRYSNVVNTSNVSETVGTQYVRFIDQTLNNAQANCVDGSAMLASIYRKIGLDTYLILVPGHCMLAIGYPGDLSIDSDLGSTGPDGGVVLMETTLMGANANHVDSFRSAVKLFSYDELQRRVDEEDYLVVNIEDARAAGFMPIKRAMRK